MLNIVAGTAGHIDHGKTALVRALTGIDTDRLEEEKRRGISIDLGFAHLDLTPEVRLSFVDVPGHERFIKNMLAGVGGIDLVVLVIAADESIKPQTREHFEICRLLRIPAGLVALTKTDLADPDIAGLARLEIEEFLRGSFLEGAPIIPVSATTGAGLDDLKRELLRLARALPARDASRPFRMPVDRAFSMRGFGTVVTGTLTGGGVALEDEVEIHPSGKRARVRGIQVHTAEVKRAEAGARTAINLAGIERAEVARGMVLAEPGRFRAVSIIDTRIELLAPLKHGSPVHFHAGSAEVEAQIRILDERYARFILREQLLILPGDRFIIRRFSPLETIGGGEVIDIHHEARGNRAQAAARLRTLDGATLADRVRLLTAESPWGLSSEELVARTGVVGPFAKHTMDPARETQLSAALEAAVRSFHSANPLAAGILKEDLRALVMRGAPPFLFDSLLARSRALTVEGETVRLAGHRVAYQADEQQALDRIERAFESAGLAVPAAAGVLAASGVEAGRARTLLQILLKNRKLVKIGDDLVFHHSAITGLRQTLASRKGQRFTVPEFKEWTGISRKYAIPLLEFLDRERVTRREGDARLVL